MVRLDDLLLGDLGHPLVDAHLLAAVLIRGGRVAEWLRSCGVGLDEVEGAFPGSAWE